MFFYFFPMQNFYNAELLKSVSCLCMHIVQWNMCGYRLKHMLTCSCVWPVFLHCIVSVSLSVFLYMLAKRLNQIKSNSVLLTCDQKTDYTVSLILHTRKQKEKIKQKTAEQYRIREGRWCPMGSPVGGRGGSMIGRTCEFRVEKSGSDGWWEWWWWSR